MRVTSLSSPGPVRGSHARRPGACDHSPSRSRSSCGTRQHPWTEARGPDSTYDVKARAYRPALARFLSPDRFADPSADLSLQSDPLTNNRYAFLAGDPIGQVEEDGHDPHGADTHERGCLTCKGKPGRDAAGRVLRSQSVIYHSGRITSNAAVQALANSTASLAATVQASIARLAAIRPQGAACYGQSPSAPSTPQCASALGKFDGGNWASLLNTAMTFAGGPIGSSQRKLAQEAGGYVDDAARVAGVADDAAKGTRVMLARDRDRLLHAAQDPRLRDAINQLYRRDAKVASGSAMDAFRFEQRTDKLLSPKGHGRKLIERRTQLQRMFRGLGGNDRRIARDLMGDIQDALGGP